VENREHCTAEQLKRVFDVATDTRKLEISLFWHRSLFFWGFISAAFIAYAAVVRIGDTEMAFIVSCFGFVCSVAWTLVNRASKYWQEVWEQKLESVEQEVLGRTLFSTQEKTMDKGILGARRSSVSRVTIALSYFAIVTWAGLAFNAFPSVTTSSRTTLAVSTAALAVSLGWAIGMLRIGRR
jgi:hypothetical protein